MEGLFANAFYFLHPHDFPLTAPHVAKPQLLPALQEFPHPEQLETVVVFAICSSATAVPLIAIANPAITKRAIIAAIIKYFILFLPPVKFT